MNWAELYQTTTDKPLGEFVAALAKAGNRRGFVIHNGEKMAMAHTFGAHGLAVAEGFDLHMIQICKPEKAAASLQKNPERAALMPKFITTFTRHGRTEVRMLRYRRPMIEALVDDAEFASSLEESFDAIVAMIEEAR
ncbi:MULTISPECIES: DUF302 domain-containing protein [Geobacter]|uniref:Uncharacterized protein n=2 Tax=Geobacter TaxID=28231 RepID=A0A0C1TT54_9BACT|nr:MULTISPECIES: DUF302 domain-containing protein [Geobacter]ANA40560.1 hypothetical protein A2G06_09950 [Geobacter anodireducens]KIE42593.1 hypothetical protein SE37_08115 [Geobacter soli]MBE2887615.1 DUF302 domain-containing protein [Geobacter anodireducens]HMN02361.1 DUF302 domain-containing protein [Geobacter anodireducens]